MGKYKDERGNRYGLLTVKQYYGTDHNGARWLCECDCGNEIVVKGLKLRSGNTRSCGCLREMPLMNTHKDINSFHEDPDVHKCWS